MDKPLILVVTIIFIIILISCSTESTTSYQLRINVEPDGAGEVNPQFNEFEEGATVTIRAIANDDWIFSRWEGASLEDSSVAEIIMVRDFEITAVFEEPKFYFTEDGTLKCQEAEVGDTQIIQGTEYIALDRLQLIEFILQNDASRVCTSLITDLSNFNWEFRERTPDEFNDDISSWDVSNVTDMSNMFNLAIEFNQSIGIWDVSSVTNMHGMFDSAISFNQDLTGWCVKNIAEEPDYFSSNSALNDEYKPLWGTCPE